MTDVVLHTILGMIPGRRFAQNGDRYRPTGSWKSYIKLSPGATEQVDKMIMDPRFGSCEIGGFDIDAAGNRIPTLGNHRYYVKEAEEQNNWWFNKSVGLIKVRESDGQNNNTFYVVYFWAKYNYESLTVFLRRLFEERIQETRQGDHISYRMKVMDINAQSYDKHTRILYTNFNGPPTIRQQNVTNNIIQRFHDDPNRNMKAFLHGPPGTGKTTVASFIKKIIVEMMNQNNQPRYRLVHMFHNFDPSLRGVEIYEHVLCYATQETPVIIVMNEIESSYEKAIANNTVHDGQIAYSDSKTRLNGMLDLISNTKHVITIFTSNTSEDELRAVDEYSSFLRFGRVDEFYEMNEPI